MNRDLDKYSHRLSIKNKICYENAYNIINKSLNRLKDKKYESNNIIRSAYKHARKKLLKGGYNKQTGGNSYLEKYLKYKEKYLELKKKRCI
jgi:hypothetical protein